MKLRKWERRPVYQFVAGETVRVDGREFKPVWEGAAGWIPEYGPRHKWMTHRFTMRTKNSAEEMVFQGTDMWLVKTR